MSQETLTALSAGWMLLGQGNVRFDLEAASNLQQLQTVYVAHAPGLPSTN